MTVKKVVELIAGSPNSWEEAVENCVKEAAKTTKGIRRAYVKNLMCIVSEDKIVEYRAEVRISVSV